MYPKALWNAPNWNDWANKPINGHTAMGMPYIHENRYQGKAAYVYTW